MGDVVQRESFKRSLLKVIKYINTVDVSKVSLIDVMVHKQHFEDYWNRFRDMHLIILDRTGEAAADLQHVEFDVTEDAYIKAASRLERIIDAISEKPHQSNDIKLQAIATMITNINTFAKNTAALTNEGIIQANRQDLDRLYIQYEQLSLEALANDSEGKVLTILNELQSLYRQTSALLISRAAELKIENRGDNEHIVEGERPPRPQVLSRLPRLDPPKFDGSVLGWESFRDLYVATIHDRTDLTAVVKFQYLKSSLEGEAESLLTNFAITTENYACAWQMLTARFDNRKVLAGEHLRYLMSLPVCKEKECDLKNLLNNTNKTIRALQNLNRPVEHWDDWIVVLVVDRLDSESRKLWEQSQSLTMDFASWTDVETFLQGRIRAVSATSIALKSTSTTSSKPPQQRNNNSVRSHQVAATSSIVKCPLCNKQHRLIFCGKFKKKNLVDKRNFVKNNQLCFNCLKSDHCAESCPSQQKCSNCQCKHHTMLHLDLSTNSSSISSNPTRPTANISSSSSPTGTEEQIHAKATTSCASLLAKSTCSPVLLATALVRINNNAGTPVVLRALLDQGSQASFITETAVQSIGLCKKNVNVTVTGIGSTQSGIAKSIVTLQCSSIYDASNHIEFDALVLRKVTCLPPISDSLHLNWGHIVGLQLADPDYHRQDRIDILLGADVYGQILRNDVRHGPPGSPTAQLTLFGYILSGQIYNSSIDTDHSTTFSSHCSIDDSIDDQLKRFWEIENAPDRRRKFTIEEKKCEDFFASTYRRNPDGRFVVRLPFHNGSAFLGNSERTAFNRMLQMEKRFQKDPTFQEKYAEFMQQYLNLGHMEAVISSSIGDHADNTNYIPHHAVMKESSSTTKIRVVFDASRKTSNGRALNEQLHIGPRLQQDLTSINMRWRKHAVVFTADIEKMYRQIRVDSKDCDLQRILWRNSSSDKMQTFRLTTVTYGTSCAPYLAIKTLQQLAIDDQAKFPIGYKIALNDFYVDDVLSGGDDVQTAIEAQHQLIGLMSAGKFQLKKWTSNREELLNELPPDHLECCLPLTFDMSDGVKTLGIFWNPGLDMFGFKIKLPPTSAVPTKRQLLSDVARLYDPLGWLAPSVILAKIFFQELWRLGIQWDDPLPSKLAENWLNFRSELQYLENIKIPRWLGTISKGRSVQIHGFCDASMTAYAAAVYVRVVQPNNNINVCLLSAKTKVAPLKTISIPRLELCGAVLLAQLLDSAVEAMSFDDVSIHAWTDSSIVLAWLAGNPLKWNVFVANRVTTILESCASRNQWRHVVSADNPADCASRGITPSELKSFALWWTGPTWLSQPENMWPLRHPIFETSEEERKSSHVTDTKIISNWDVMDKYSSLTKLTRVVAYVQRFWANCRVNNSHQTSGPMTTIELSLARRLLIKTTQNQSFKGEIDRLSKKLPLSKSSSIIRLTPFLDDHGILRVGGRLHRSLLSFNERHPIIIPRHSKLTELLVAHAHLQNMHGGVQATLGYLRRQYWVIDGRNQVRQHIHRCIRCFRQKAKTQTQIMASLPSARITPRRPFLHTAVDYSGFIKVRSAKGRGHTSTKAYIALFVCMATKAIHLEVVSDLTSVAFIAAFRRFTGRRGICTDIYSDNGTNFVGANKDLKQQREAAARGQTTEIIDSLSKDGTTWHFSPPLSPHFNGLAEAGIRSTKHHLKRVIGETTLTFEELTTVLVQIEACLNSRPLSPVTSDPEDISPLTPGHFLIGTPLIAVPERSILENNPNHLSRWKQVQQIVQQFWKRWSKEYIHHLQQRSKWSTLQPDLQIGNMVLIKEDNLPPAKWQLGRITGTRPGPDGRVRVVCVRHGRTESDRPIVKLALLPIPT